MKTLIIGAVGMNDPLIEELKNRFRNAKVITELLTDWMGNEIKEGHEVVVIKVLDRQYFKNFRFFIPSKNVTEVSANNELDKPCWEILQTLKVIRQPETLNQLGYCIKEEGVVMYDTFSSMLIFSTIRDTSILAIKGVSDNKELYLKNKNK